MLLRIAYKTYKRLLVIALYAAAWASPGTAGSQSLPDSAVVGGSSSYYVPLQQENDSLINNRSAASELGHRDNDSVGSLPDSLTVEPPAPGENPVTVADTTTAGDSIVVRRAKSKEKKERPKTLDTYFFPDSLMKHKVLIWTINSYLNTPKMRSIDTTMNENRTELPIYKTDVGASSLGPTGSAALLYNYFKRKRSNLFLFMEPYSMYARTSEEAEFYNTKSPYTDLSYYTSGNRKVVEDNLRVIFAANVFPEWNFGLSYKRMGARGVHQRQKTDTKSFSMFTSYAGKRYLAHAGYLYNSVKNQENGGITNDFFMTDTLIRSDAIDVKLRSASNSLSSDTYFLSHSYGVPVSMLNKMRKDSLGTGEGTMVYFGHSLEYSRYKRIYADGPADTAYIDYYASPNAYSHYYDKYYISRSSSYDSAFASTFDNRAFVRLQPYSPTAILAKIDGGIGYAFDKYYTFSPASYLQGQYADKLSTGYVYGNAQGMLGKYFVWDAFLKYHFSGYRVNDLLLDASARVSIYPLKGGLHFEGRFMLDNREQAYHLKRYYSNHLRWNENFDKTTETRIEIKLSAPDWDLEAGFHNSLLVKHVYFGLDARPLQSADALNITAVYAQKNLKWWLLHLDSRLLLQLTSNSEAIPLPLFSGNAALYLQSEWVRNVLDTQIGFDVSYNTAFYDYAYNPAAGMFHTQNEKQIGGYPWFDAFANFKWKRANIYVKFTNVLDGIIGGRNYFSALHYPRNGRMLRFGVNWFFFN